MTIASDPAERATVWARLLIPVATVVALWISVPFTFPERADGFYGLLLGYVVPPLGKESVIPSAALAGYSPLLTATYLASIDAATAWVLAWNWDLLLRLPFVGAVLGRFTERMQGSLAAKERRVKAAFWGLVLFAFVPFQGSGAISGTVVGRLLGLGPSTTWLAVILGVTTSAYLIALATLGITALPPVLKWTLVGCIVIVVLIQGVRFWRKRP